MVCLLSLIVASSCLAVCQDPAPGIDRELARARKACVSGVRYEVAFELTPNGDEVRGRVRATFELRGEAAPDAPVVLDFAGHDLSVDGVNGRRPGDALRRVANHVVVPADHLVRGRNTFEASFASKVASTGTPLTRYVDAADDREYLYTLVVPADAHRLFPCFDQPDLKAVFDLRLTLPKDWVAVANGAELATSAIETRDGDSDDRREWVFAPTQPLSTYLFAFAAGPFAVREGPAWGGRPIRIFHRESRADDIDFDLLFGMHVRSLRWLESYFGTPYPFGKLDLVLAPGFPYGGMEHAGAIFYRESALAFDREPTETEKLRRSTLIYHEVSHQWFGNLVTMEWFDDLWLKEGFATFVGYRALEALEPGKNAWLRFHQRVKPRAYAIDSTAGTTPIYQELANLADAKSAYGAIVYNKAPAVLRELEARLGPDRFRDGVRSFLREHAFDNASWQDLVDAFRSASGMRGSSWTDAWVLRAGMPIVRAEWSTDDDGTGGDAGRDAPAEGGARIASFAITQRGTRGHEENTWPLAVEVLLLGPGDGQQRRVRVTADGARTEVPELRGEAAPDCVILNPADVAYGLFVADPRSRRWLLEHLPGFDDPLVRAVALSALWNAVREAELDPRAYTGVANRLLRIEADPASHARLLGTLGTTLSRYLRAPDRAAASAELAALLLGQLETGIPGRELQTVRFLTVQCPTAPVRELARGLLTGDRVVSGLELGWRDHFAIAAGLLAAGQADAVALARRHVPDGADAAREIYVASAAAADADTKRRYFESYANRDEPPEQWMQQSLSTFHWPGQGSLTLPYLTRALERVEWVKDNRKIFFMPAWLDAFINGHSSAAALQIVDEFLERRADLTADVRQKILQSRDDLERAVRIRETWR